MYELDPTERRYVWEFTLDDGTKRTAKFTDSEIEDFKKIYRDIFWV